MKNIFLLALVLIVSALVPQSCQKSPPTTTFPDTKIKTSDLAVTSRSCSSGCPILLSVENANWESGDYVLFIYPNEDDPGNNDYKVINSTTSQPVSACAGAGTVYIYIYGGPMAAYVDVESCSDANEQVFHFVNGGSGNVNCSASLDDCNSGCWTLGACGGLSAH